MNSIIAICLTTYNRPKYLKIAIDSILNQTFKNFRLIILDNGSDIRTSEVIKAYRDKRITYIRNKINDNEFINKAFEFTSQKYMMITHDDDIMSKNFLENQISLLEDDSSIGVIASRIMLIDEEGNNLSRIRPRVLGNKVWGQKEFIREYFYRGDIIPCPTCIFRSEIISSNKIKYNFKVGPAVDLFLLFEMNLLETTIFLSKKALYKYRIHNNQLSEINRINLELSIRPFIIRLLESKNELGLLKDYKRASSSIILHIIMHQFLIRKIPYKKFKDLLNRKDITSDLSFNKFSILWILIAIFRSIKN
ncbi:glycosyltransferase family 2 protein [Flavobacteriaceae bacterium]|nr:glycosyltransferase family 2 protein [Flavobacteriaceae bacterium]